MTTYWAGRRCFRTALLKVVHKFNLPVAGAFSGFGAGISGALGPSRQRGGGVAGPITPPFINPRNSISLSTDCIRFFDGIRAVADF